MRALAYLLGARAHDAERGPDTGIHWPKFEEPLGPIASTEATAAAWRRWRDRADAETAPTAPQRAPSPLLRRVGTPG
jgi:hypothetical protein